MLQESVYCRMVINEAMAKSVVARIEGFKPPQGMVCAMIITEKQFAGISFIAGDFKSDDNIIYKSKILEIIRRFNAK